jgi:hypothetical protein
VNGDYSSVRNIATEIGRQMNLIPTPTPDEAQPAWENYTVPAGYQRAGDVFTIRRCGKVVEIDFDGEILRAKRRSRDRVFVRFPDGQEINESSFDKAMSKVAVARQHAREYRLLVQRSREAEERERELRQQAEKAAQEAVALRERERERGERLASAIESEPRPAKARSRNTSRHLRPRTSVPDESDFINPCDYRGPFSYGPAVR